MAEDRPTISTHVLDTRPGPRRPASRSSSGGPGRDGVEAVVGEGITDADGRIRDLLAGSRLEAGAYRLEFGLDDGGFFTGLSVDIRVDDPSRSVHVPLLRAPFGLSTYRGS